MDAYVEAVANDEWETMKDGESSPQASAALEAMHSEYHTVEPKGASETETYSQALDNLNAVGAMRRERLNIAAADLPTILRVLVVIGVFLLLVLEYRPELSRLGGLVFMGTLAMVVTSAFLLTVILNYPFAGQVSVSNAPLKEDNLARFWSEELAYRPQPGDESQPLTAQRLEGVYNSDAYGTLVLNCYDEGGRHAVRDCEEGDTRLRGVYRYHDGTIIGEIEDGVFEGWWTEGPDRNATTDDSGQVDCGSWRRRMDRSSPAIGATASGSSSPAGISRRSAAPRRRTCSGAWKSRTASSRPRPRPDQARAVGAARAACPFSLSAGPETISIARSTSGTASGDTTCQLHWCVVWFQSSSRSG